ncbi:hypothetical protein EKO04_003004 [Ascochyta lentis]|uniref:Uncharacterized protein n=1 Tax=Ascochyta lentis TaxID=205686 RepID=A0A8H7J9U7_9PLEO|nr:hypothetical protein EKO04_003004 [Ascochyta lentis]
MPKPVTPESTPDAEVVSQSSLSLAHYLGLVGWLFVPHYKTPRTPRRSISEEHACSAPTTATTSTPFQHLPTEIHFRIAAYLPDHTLHVLAGYKQNVRLRRIYGNADPQGLRTRKRNLSAFEHSVHQELMMRDAFEMTHYPQNSSSGLHRAIWSETLFHCLSCNQSVGTAHFPMSEMLESTQTRTGMSKIIDRQCRAELTPVLLWDDRVITWSQLQEAWADMDPYILMPPIFSDYGQHNSTPLTSTSNSRRYTREPNTLRLRDLDQARTAPLLSSNSLPRELGVEATAEYYTDLYRPLRIQRLNATTIATTIRQRDIYICPHLHLAELLLRPMSEQPVDFRPHGPGPFAAGDRIVHHLARGVDQRAWKDDAARRAASGRACWVKEQAVCCGFNDEECRSAVFIQRCREGGVGGWLRDLVRLRVVRKWRVDRGTGDEGWQAQNGSSVEVVDVV